MVKQRESVSWWQRLSGILLATMVLSIGLSQAYARSCSAGKALGGAHCCTSVAESACCCTPLAESTTLPCECALEDNKETVIIHFDGSRSSVPQLLTAHLRLSDLPLPATARSANSARVAQQLPATCSTAVLCRFLL